MESSGHIRELRNRVIVVVSVFLLFFVLAFIKSDKLISLCMDMGREAGFSFIYTAMQEILMEQIHLAGIVAGMLSLPVIVYELIMYISPVLDEKKSVRKLFVGEVMGLILFGVGCIFAIKVLFPFVCQYLYSSNSTIEAAGQIAVTNYCSFLFLIMVCIGGVFEIPLVCVILDILGVLSSIWMKKARSIIVVLSFIVSAFITPPDVFSMFMVAVPMVLLYQISIGLCKIVEKQKGVRKPNEKEKTDKLTKTGK